MSLKMGLWSRDHGFPRPLRWVAALALGFLVGCGGDDADPSTTGGDPPAPQGPDTTPWSGAYGEITNDVFIPWLKLDVDRAGNVALVGGFLGTLDLGGGPIEGTPAPAGFLAKFDAKGRHLWSRKLAAAFPRDVAFDGDGNIIVLGDLDGTEDLGGGPLAAADAQDIFVVKLDSDGGHLWSKAFGPGGTQRATGVVVKDGGEIVLSGYVMGTTDVGGGPLESADHGALVAQLGADGSHQWSRLLPGQMFPEGLAADPEGALVVSAGGSVMKLDAGGADVWSRALDAAGAVDSRVAWDAGGNVLVTGQFQGALQIGDLALTAASTEPLEPGENDYDGFVAKLDPGGVPLWARRFGDGGYATGTSVAAAGDDIALAGRFDVGMDLGAGKLTGRDCGNGFAARLDAEGNAVWTRGYTAEGSFLCLTVEDMAMSGTTNPVMAGFFAGTADFGSGPVTREPDWHGWTVFVAKLPE